LGIHDVRLVNKWGISNPRAFVVGDLAEVLEKEPNNDVPEAQRVALNSTINGVISAPTDVDFYVFAGTKGQRVVMSCLGLSIDSRLQAAVALYDARGRLLGENYRYTAHRYHANNDALLDVTLPADGDYYVRVFNFTYTGGTPEYFYRLSISTSPWIDAIHPCVVQAGKPTNVTVWGRNLPGGQPDPTAVVDGRVLEKVTVTINPPADPAALTRLTYSGFLSPSSSAQDGFEYRLSSPAGISNPYLLTFARAPVVLDNEANDTPETAQEVPVPCEIAGRIEKKHDRDWYSFTAKKGEVYNIEVISDRLGAPTDMYFVLRNPATKQDIVEQDDNPDTLSPKCFARTDDPTVYKFAVPADGKYQLLVASRLADSFADPRHLYRVRISPAEPDFRLVVMAIDYSRPDSGCLLQGGNEAYTVFVWRQDGFNGEVTLTAEELPPGVTCPPQILAGNQRQTKLVLTAAPDAAEWTGEIKIKGTATIKGQPVVREARPASITWPVQPQQNIPTLTRLDRQLVLAVRDKVPYSVAATIDKPAVVQGDKATINLKLTRVWPDLKNPLTVQLVDPPEPPIANLIVNNNQPVTIAPGADTAAVPVQVNPNVLPGTYNLVFRTQTQIPYNKDPKAAQKPPVNVVLPSAPVALTVLPKTVATVTASVPNANVKAGAATEVIVKVARQFEYAGEFKVALVLPPNVAGVSADEVTIPAGMDEVKLVLKAAADAAAGPRADLLVRATAMFNGNVAVTQEAKFTVTVVK
jgi:hypothetical protein